jgi:hypothetical protein
MPFKSQAQRRKFAQLLVEGKISNETFEEWNRETGGAALPERAKTKVKPRGKRETKAKAKPRRGRKTAAKVNAKARTSRKPRPRARKKAR